MSRSSGRKRPAASPSTRPVPAGPSAPAPIPLTPRPRLFVACLIVYACWLGLLLVLRLLTVHPAP
jgi:hypothetical protein